MTSHNDAKELAKQLEEAGDRNYVDATLLQLRHQVKVTLDVIVAGDDVHRLTENRGFQQDVVLGVAAEVEHASRLDMCCASLKTLQYIVRIGSAVPQPALD